MLVGWWHMIKDAFGKKPVNDEFVSYNARRLSEPDASYEMLGSKKTPASINSETTTASPAMLRISSTSNQPLPKSYLPSRSSMLTSSPISPETDANSPNGHSSQFLPYNHKTETAFDSDDDFHHHALSPKPPSASYRR